MANKRILIIATELTGTLISNAFESLRAKVLNIITLHKITKVIAYRGPRNEVGHQTLLKLLKNMPGLPEIKYDKIFNLTSPTPEAEDFIRKRTVEARHVYDYEDDAFWEQVRLVTPWMEQTVREDGSELIIVIVDFMLLNGFFISENQVKVYETKAKAQPLENGDDELDPKATTRILIPGDSIELTELKGEIVRNGARLKKRLTVLANAKK